MANLRTQKAIPAGVWTLIINGKTSARVFEKKVLQGGYITLEYGDAADNPNTLTIPVSPNSDTAENMVFRDQEWIYENSALGYVWAAPVGDVDGILGVTV